MPMTTFRCPFCSYIQHLELPRIVKQSHEEITDLKCKECGNKLKATISIIITGDLK